MALTSRWINWIPWLVCTPWWGYCIGGCVSWRRKSKSTTVLVVDTWSGGVKFPTCLRNGTWNVLCCCPRSHQLVKFSHISDYEIDVGHVSNSRILRQSICMISDGNLSEKVYYTFKKECLELYFRFFFCHHILDHYTIYKYVYVQAKRYILLVLITR